MNNIITIDGPTGSGRTEIAPLVAQKLGLRYINSGKLYRAAAYLLLQNNIDLQNDAEVSRVLNPTDFVMDEKGRVSFKGTAISDDVLYPSLAMDTAKIAQNENIRTLLLDRQRAMGTPDGCVIEGVSTGIEVFPEADLKVWLGADDDVRLERLIKADGEAVANEAMNRDKIDAERELAPLAKAEDALIIDTTHANAEQVASDIVRRYEQLEVEQQ